MQKTNTGCKVAACLAASVLLGSIAHAQPQIVYDNTLNRSGTRTGEGNSVIGDVATLGGTFRTISQIEFEYFITPAGGAFPAGGAANANLSLYSIDASTGLPSTLLYTSPGFALTPQTPFGFGSVKIAGISVDVPGSVAWTVGVTGLDTVGGETEEFGLLYFNPVNFGSSPTFTDATGLVHDYFIKNNGGTWQLLDTPSVVDNLNIRFTAVPEPSTIALLVGGLATIGFIRRRK